MCNIIPKLFYGWIKDMLVIKNLQEYYMKGQDIDIIYKVGLL